MVSVAKVWVFDRRNLNRGIRGEKKSLEKIFNKCKVSMSREKPELFMRNITLLVVFW